MGLALKMYNGIEGKCTTKHFIRLGFWSGGGFTLCKKQQSNFHSEIDIHSKYKCNSQCEKLWQLNLVFGSK